jgi:hypothetical protein
VTREEWLMSLQVGLAEEVTWGAGWDPAGRTIPATRPCPDCDGTGVIDHGDGKPSDCRACSARGAP